MRVFKIPAVSVFTNYLTPSGAPVSFYKGYCTSDDPATCEFILTLKDAEEVKGMKLDDVPKPPVRSRGRTWATAGPSPTVITPTEVLQRAVANSKATPQAAQSTSVPTPVTK